MVFIDIFTTLFYFFIIMFSVMKRIDYGVENDFKDFITLLGAIVIVSIWVRLPIYIYN